MHLRRIALACHAVACLAGADQIASGPWVGGVTPTSAVVAARLPAAGLQARLLVSTSADLSAPRAGPLAVSGPGGAVRVVIDGLEPASRWYGAIEVAGQLQTAAERRVGFSTFPSGASDLRIAFGSCSDMAYAGPAFSAIIAEDPQLFLMTGDMHYRDTNTTVADDYRGNYDRVFAVPAVAELYRRMATAYTWDDHDFCGNDSSGASAGRDVARAVFRERVPHYPLADPGAIHQAFAIGRVRVVLSDLRSASDFRGKADGPDKTRMGSAQKAWFKQQLVAARDAEAPLILWVSSVPWISGGSGSDNWGSYASERRELADFIRDAEIRNVVVLAGDMHALAWDDGSNSDYATGGGAPLRVLHAASLAKTSSHKGGPYASGTPIPVSTGVVVHQYGLLDIRDPGGPEAVSVAFAGMPPAPLRRCSTTASSAGRRRRDRQASSPPPLWPPRWRWPGAMTLRSRAAIASSAASTAPIGRSSPRSRRGPWRGATPPLHPGSLQPTASAPSMPKAAAAHLRSPAWRRTGCRRSAALAPGRPLW